MRRSFIAAAAALMAYPWLRPTRAQDVVQTVLVGVASPTAIPRGQNTFDAVEFAIEQVNARGLKVGGRRIVLQSFSIDDKNDVNLAVLGAHAAVAANVVGMVGHLTSDTTIAAAKVYHEAGIPLLAPNAASKDLLQPDYDNVFQLLGHSEYTARFLAQTAVKLLGGRRIMVIDTESALGIALARSFAAASAQLGARVVATERVGPRSSDFNAAVAKIRASAPDLVVFTGVVPQSIALALRLRQVDLDVQLLMGGGAINPEFPQTGQYPNGALILAGGVPVERVPDFRRLESLYYARYQTRLIPQSWFCYDAVFLLAAAMERANSTDPRKLSPVLREMRYTGQSGPIAFLDDGSLEKPRYTLYRAEQGQWKSLRTLA